METTSPTSPPFKKNVAPAKPLPFQIRAMGFVFRYLGKIFPDAAARVALKMFMTPKRHVVKEVPEILERAFMLGIPYKNGKVRAYLWGYTGKIVLLVHGWESGVHMFAPFVAPLLEAGYRVVAVEGPAHGGSKLKQTNMVDFGDALQAVMDRLEKSGGVSIVIGHSFGGSTLMHLFTRFSPPAALEKVILIAIPARINQIFYRYFQMMQLPITAVEKFTGTVEEIFGLKIEALHVKHWLVGTKGIRTLIVHDKHDTVIDFEEAEELVSHSPLAILVETESLGHYRIMKSEKVISKAIQFLN